MGGKRAVHDTHLRFDAALWEQFTAQVELQRPRRKPVAQIEALIEQWLEQQRPAGTGRKPRRRE